MARGSVTDRIAESYLRELLEDNLDMSAVPDQVDADQLLAGVVMVLLGHGGAQYRPRAGQIVLSFMVDEPAPKRRPKLAESAPVEP